MNGYIEQGTSQYKKAISALFLGSIAAFGAEYCVQPIIPVLARDFALSPSVASLAMSFGTMGMSVAMLAIAVFAGVLERKKTMAIALIVSAILTIIMAFSNNFNIILGLRVIQGILLAAFPALALAYINEEFNPKIVGLAVGCYISGTSIGGLLGRVTISTLTDFFSWREGLVGIGIIYLVIGVWFWFSLPKSQRHTPSKKISANIITSMLKILQNKKVRTIYAIAFVLLGAFTAMYNYIAYPLMEAPYNLSQTAIGALFIMYLLGTFSSTFMGGLSDKLGNGKVLCLSISIMLVGGILTIPTSLALKIIGLAVFTFGFFGSHATACSWAGKCVNADKAQVSAMYMLFYYLGSSVIGTVGGVFLAEYGWIGVICIISTVLGCGLLLAVRLTVKQTIPINIMAHKN